MKAIRVIAIIAGALFILVGVLWVLQGTSVVNQGFMAGQNRWTLIGSIVAVVGLALIIIGSLRGKGRRGTPAA
jgi:hypothetical protein